jgi:hypothetical protein
LPNLAYSDDSKTKHNNVEWQVMSTVLVKDVHFRELELRVGLIAEELLPRENYDQFTEFHACDLYNGTNAFKGMEWAQRMSILEVLLRTLETLEIPVIYGAVDLSQLNNKIYASANPIDMTFRMCSLGVQEWMGKQLQGKRPKEVVARLTFTRRSPLFSKSSLGNEHRASCSALDKGNPSLRQTSSAAICTRPLRNWATSIRLPERTKLGTMRSVVLGIRACELCGMSRGPIQVLDGPCWKGHERPLRQDQRGRCIP